MGEFGRFALLLGFCLCSYAIPADLLGTWRGREELWRSGRRATIACLGCLTVATVALWVLLVRGDFGVLYVAEHTSRALPLMYKLTALWAGASGSLLLWLWLQCGFVVFAFAISDKGRGPFCAHARAAANLVAVAASGWELLNTDLQLHFDIATAVPSRRQHQPPLTTEAIACLLQCTGESQGLLIVATFNQDLANSAAQLSDPGVFSGNLVEFHALSLPSICDDTSASLVVESVSVHHTE